MLVIIFFNIELFSLLHSQNKEYGEYYNRILSYADTVTKLSDQMSSITHSVSGIHYFSHHVKDDESWNIQFINSTKNLDALLVFVGYLYLAT